MIRIQNDIESDSSDPLASVLLDTALMDALRKRDIDVGNFANPDFVFALANNLQDTGCDIKPNTIAFERLDGCQIRNKRILASKNLLKLVKMYKYADIETNNIPCVDGRVFTSLLTAETTQPKALVTREMFDKVATGTSFLHYKRHDQCEALARAMPDDYAKDIDVFFAGTTSGYSKHGHESGQLISQHRIACVNKLQEITGLNIIAKADKAYNAVDYLNHIARAKITVSPWGWGESCYRDYEALMLRTEVIKPCSFRYESNPDIYAYNVAWCVPSWRDLEEVIRARLALWEARARQRKDISDAVINARQPAAIASTLSYILQEAL